MLEKLKNYYRNSPKRIALTWIVIHILFLVIGLAGVQYVNNFSQLFVMSLYAIFFFPSVPFGYIGSEMLTLFIPPLYYSLFVFMCLKAKDTNTKKFRISSTFFTAWFLLSLCILIFAVLATIF